MNISRNNNSPVFGVKLVLSNAANEMLEGKITKYSLRHGAKVGEAYNKLIKDIVNSDYDVFVSCSNENKLFAKVTKHDKKEILSQTTEIEGKAPGEYTPFDFIITAFNNAKEKFLIS